MKFIAFLMTFFLVSLKAYSITPDWRNHSELTSAPVVDDCSKNHCVRSASYELALEKEYWRHVQADDTKGMVAWLKKMKKYTEASSHKDKYLRQKGRLWMLGAGGHTMLFAEYDIHKLVPLVNSIVDVRLFRTVPSFLSSLGTLPALQHLKESIRLSTKANQNIPEHLNGQTFFTGIMGFAQFALSDVLGGNQAALNTIYGPSCESVPPRLQKILLGGLCFEKGAMGPLRDSYLECYDDESCKKVGTGTEGIVASILTLGMLHDESLVRSGLEALGDDPESNKIANCDAFWCHFSSPNNEKSRLPEATSIAPFKTVVMLLAIAEMYGKLGETDKVARSFAAARREAERLEWPFMHRIAEIEEKLLKKGGLQEQWSNSEGFKDHLGSVQFPLPEYGKGCKGCHFGGVLPDHVDYESSL